MIYDVEYTGEDGKRYSINITAITEKDAEHKARTYGLKDPKTKGRLVMTIPTKTDGITPDWSRAIDHEKPLNN